MSFMCNNLRYFTAFVTQKCPEFMFCTDAFTKFERTTLLFLVKAMTENPNVSVATGRQRVMTEEQQSKNIIIILLVFE
jgi:hypothetical protein